MNWTTILSEIAIAIIETLANQATQALREKKRFRKLTGATHAIHSKHRQACQILKSIANHRIIH